MEEGKGQEDEDTPHEEREEGVVEGEQQHQHERQLPGFCGCISDPEGETLVLVRHGELNNNFSVFFCSREIK